MSASIPRTVTERHVQLFGEATGDMNAVHFTRLARKTVFRAGGAWHAEHRLHLGLAGPNCRAMARSFCPPALCSKFPVRIGDTVVTTATVRGQRPMQLVLMDCFRGRAEFTESKPMFWRRAGRPRLALKIKVRIFAERRYPNATHAWPLSCHPAISASVHRGHRALIAQAETRADARGRHRSRC
jgi:hypothetical protein